MKHSLRYMLLFSGPIIAGVYLHEIGHAVAGWVNGVVVVLTLDKEYILQSQLDSSKEIWIALGDVIGTTVAALAAAFCLWHQPCSDREVVAAGAFLPLGLYTLRFLLVGRGHDPTEWQTTQAALDLAPDGHAIDLFFPCLLIAGLAVWAIRLNARPSSVLRLVSMPIIGIILLISPQAGDNAVLDQVFPVAEVVNLPRGFDAQ
jgi:hypothetical protein